MMSVGHEREDGVVVEVRRDMMGNGSLMELLREDALVVVGGLSRLRQGLKARPVGDERRGTRRSDEERGRGG